MPIVPLILPLFFSSHGEQRPHLDMTNQATVHRRRQTVKDFRVIRVELPNARKIHEVARCESTRRPFDLFRRVTAIEDRITLVALRPALAEHAVEVQLLEAQPLHPERPTAEGMPP